jgi:erythromycin esterase-like protein
MRATAAAVRARASSFGCWGARDATTAAFSSPPSECPECACAECSPLLTVVAVPA